MRIPRELNDKAYVDPNNLSKDLGGVHLNSGVTNYLFYKMVCDIGLKHINEVLGLWYRVYCKLPENCNWITFGVTLHKECPNKWISHVIGNLSLVGILHDTRS